MKKSEDIFRLIKSLNQTEKRYFRVFASRHIIGKKNIYVTLFDIVLKQKEYDEASIKKKFAHQSFIKHLPSHKIYLYKLIMRSLRNYHSGNKADFRIKELLIDMDILFGKRLFFDCLKALKKVKQESIKYGKINMLPEIITWERRLGGLGFSTKEFNYDSSFEETKASLKKIHDFHEYEYTARKLAGMMRYNLFIRNPTELENATKIMSSSLMKDENNAVSCFGTYFYLRAWGNFHQYKGELDKAIEYETKNVVVMEQNEHIIKENSIYYLFACNNLAATLVENSAFKEAYAVINKVKQLKKKLKLSIYSDLLWFEIITMQQTNLDVYTGKFEEVIKVVPSVKKEIQKYEGIIDPINRQAIYFNIAYSYFGMEKYRDTLKWINALLYNIVTEEITDVESITRILLLMTHYEMGNKDVLESNISWTFKFYEKRKKLYEFEKLILNFFKQSLNDFASKKTQADSFIKLKKQIIPLTANPFESNIIKEFRIIEWIESKIQKRSFAELVKERSI